MADFSLFCSERRLIVEAASDVGGAHSFSERVMQWSADHWAILEQDLSFPVVVNPYEKNFTRTGISFFVARV